MAILTEEGKDKDKSRSHRQTLNQNYLLLLNDIDK